MSSRQVDGYEVHIVDGHVELPVGVTKIGDPTFATPASFSDFRDPREKNMDGYAFASCASLKSITIPSTVTDICPFAFFRCESLTSVIIPSSVTDIGLAAFKGCTSLMSVTIPSSVTTIRGCAFSNCSSLISVAIPSSLTEIEEGAFQNCLSLKSVTIPSSVTEIEACMFLGCHNLTLVTIPSSITKLIKGTFLYCLSLTSVAIPSSVTEIDTQTFTECAITAITIPTTCTLRPLAFDTKVTIIRLTPDRMEFCYRLATFVRWRHALKFCKPQLFAWYERAALKSGSFSSEGAGRKRDIEAFERDFA